MSTHAQLNTFFNHNPPYFKFQSVQFVFIELFLPNYQFEFIVHGKMLAN